MTLDEAALILNLKKGVFLEETELQRMLKVRIGVSFRSILHTMMQVMRCWPLVRLTGVAMSPGHSQAMLFSS